MSFRTFDEGWLGSLSHAAPLALAALLPIAMPPLAAPTLPAILCSTLPAEDARPASVVSILQSEAVGDGSDRRMTTLLVHFPAHARTPRHIHGGALTAYVISGRVRSQLDAGPIMVFGRGDSFHEPMGTIHTLIENPDDDPADLLATIVHVPGAPLTTLLP